MKHKNFFVVPNQIFKLGLTPKEFVVYCCLLSIAIKITTTAFHHDGSSQMNAAWIRKRLTLRSRDWNQNVLSRRSIATEKTVLEQAICTTSHRSWNSVEFPLKSTQMITALRTRSSSWTTVTQA